MTAWEFKQIAPQIKMLTDYVYLHIKGEPLMHPELEAILDVCEKEKLQVNITTNGVLLNKKSDILFKNDCIRQVNISAHVLGEKLPITLDEYLKGIARVVEFVKRTQRFYLSIRFWIDNEEMKEVAIDYLKRECDIHITEGTNEVAPNVFLSNDEEFVWPSLRNDFVSEKGTCHATKDHIGILSNGDVVPCCLDSLGVMTLGNCFENSLIDIINSERFNNIKNGFTNRKIVEELCKHCSYRLKFK